MTDEKFWEEWKKLDGKFGAENTKLCKKHGFVTSLEGWDYCPFCGGELCEQAENETGLAI